MPIYVGSINLLFDMGAVYTTSGIRALMDGQGLDVIPYLERHVSGDFGELCHEDEAANRAAIYGQGRVFSVYFFIPPRDPDNRIKLWVITEADRSTTTVLLPDEY